MLIFNDSFLSQAITPYLPSPQQFANALHSARLRRRKVINLLNTIQHLLKIDVKILQVSILQIKHPPMDNRIVVILIALLNSSSLENIPTRLDHIQLHKPIKPVVVILDLIQLRLMQTVHVADISKPRVKDSQISRR